MTDDFITINTNPTATKVSLGEILQLVDENDPILRTVIGEFDFNDPSLDPQKISDDLTKTLKTHRAFGIAAPQCGLYHRVFVIGAEDSYITMFNPEILSVSEKQVHMPEYCLSFPFLELNISRPEHVTVKYQDVNGKEHIDRFVGITARCCLHELDHLNGQTFHKYAKPLALKNGLKKREKHIKQFARELVAQRRITNA